MELYSASSPADALKFCHSLIRDGRADLFRGQHGNWPLLPSLLRRSGDDRKAAISRLSHFFDWAENVPQMDRYAGHRDSLTAIAQHYGVPTKFLDWSTEPDVALYFAQDAGTQVPGESASIYCITKAALDSLGGSRLLEIPVENLWRLKAQHGVFVELESKPDAKALEAKCFRIEFRPQANPPERANDIYPNRKSVLELAIDEWLYRDELGSMLDAIRENTRFFAGIKRHTYPGVFYWRIIPDIPLDWVEGHFLISSRSEQPLPHATRHVPAEVEVGPLDSFSESLDLITGQLSAPVDEAHAHSCLLDLRLTLCGAAEMHHESIKSLMERCWDGLRPFPYTSPEALNCLALCLTVLAGRAAQAGWRDQWAEERYTDTEVVEFAPFGGHIGSAIIGRADLFGAIRRDAAGPMVDYYKRLLRRRPHEIFRYVTDPWHLFDRGRFQTLFAEQVIPSAFDAYWTSDLELHEGKLGGLWDVAFDPVHLGYFTPAEYRFRSPLQLEAAPEDLILVMPDMTKPDLRDAFTFAYPKAALAGEPYTTRFAGYEFDQRELFDVPKVVRQCREIVEVGGISVLEVFPEDERRDKQRPAALMAFHIWLMAQGMLKGAAGKRIEFGSEIMQRFRSELLQSNGVADAAFRDYVRRYGERLGRS